MTASAHCPECGYSKVAKSQALAQRSINLHSCEKTREMAARRARRIERENSSGERRECTHKRTFHAHGTANAYILDGCKCRPCRNALAQRENARNKAKAFGRYDSGRVDAKHVRAHLLKLRKHGMGLKRIAELAGVSNATLGKVLYGDPAHGRPLRKRVARHVHDQVLAIQPTLENLQGGTLVDALGIRRRLQALVAIGYSQTHLAGRIGFVASNFCKLTLDPSEGGRTAVTAATARKVTALYAALQNRPRVGCDQRTKISVSRARNIARARGWLPPAAWDEDRMDDPKHNGYAWAVAS